MKTRKNKVLFFVLILMLFNINTVKADTITKTCYSPNDCICTDNKYPCTIAVSNSSSGVSTRKKCITCGEVNTIPASIPTFSRNVINLVQVLVPAIIVIMGIVTFLKALVSGEDKALSQARTHFIRMILVGIAILLIVTIIKLVFSFAAKSDDVNSIMKCISCFTTDENACNITTCPERNSGTATPSSSGGTNNGESSNNVPNSTTKKCGDYGTAGECNSDPENDCKWSTNGNFCEVR